MKRFVTVLTVIAFSLSFGLTAFAVKIDGIARNSEWSQAEVFDLSEQKKFGNSVKNGVIKAQNSIEDGCVYFLIMTEFDKDGDKENGEIILCVNGEDEAEISILDGLVYDGGYDIDTAVFYDENSGTSIVEAAVYFKDDITPSDVFTFNIVDFQGEESNTFSFSFTQEEDEEPAADTEENTPKSKASKTAKAKSSSKKNSSKKSKTTDSFNFKKVEKNDAESDEESVKTEKADKTNTSLSVSEDKNEPQSEGLNRKYIYAGIGSVCAMGVAVAAVVSAMKSNDAKNKKDE